MPVEFLISALVTLAVVVDPIALVPSYLAVTEGLPHQSRRDVALRACLIAAGVLAGTAFAGAWLLHALAISLPAFRIAGGLLLFYIAFEMIFELRGERKQALATGATTIDQIRNVAAFPLAIPLMSGPGSITATMLLAGRAGSDWRALTGLMAIVAAVPLLFLPYIAGTPTIWIIAFLALGTRWPAAAALILVKPTLLPFALIGIREWRFWVVCGALGLVSIAMVSMTLDWIRAVTNLTGEKAGVLYSIENLPLVAVVLIAWLTGRHEPRWVTRLQARASAWRRDSSER